MLLNTSHPAIQILPFRPLRGLSSPHLQTILPILFAKSGQEAPSAPFVIQLSDGDALYTRFSTPPYWKPNQKTIVLLHGLGGSDSSAYMIRFSRKLYLEGYRTVRINLRGSGKGVNYANRPYNGGTSRDILESLQTIKMQTPESPLILIGYSLGGNITLKLLGEMGDMASNLIEAAVAVCPPLDLMRTVELLSTQSNRRYHNYYVKGLRKMCSRWIKNRTLSSIFDFDNLITAPLWGYQSAEDYYLKCSSLSFIPRIQVPCHIIYSADDPFVDYRPALNLTLSGKVKIWISRYGGHMGFFGWAGKEHGCHWLDAILLKFITNKECVYA